eukprot:c5309_g1_i1.p1 GENE.c5309_g1_i1~~c5309_g1_i1.p1  ORF type:complete len:655 (+),score=150.76 c5309_g1_i1:45-1967(+)
MEDASIMGLINRALAESEDVWKTHHKNRATMSRVVMIGSLSNVVINLYTRGWNFDEYFAGYALFYFLSIGFCQSLRENLWYVIFGYYGMCLNFCVACAALVAYGFSSPPHHTFWNALELMPDLGCQGVFLTTTRTIISPHFVMIICTCFGIPKLHLMLTGMLMFASAGLACFAIIHMCMPDQLFKTVMFSVFLTSTGLVSGYAILLKEGVERSLEQATRDREIKERNEQLAHEESVIKTRRKIVGYIFHEVRNPMHLCVGALEMAYHHNQGVNPPLSELRHYLATSLGSSKLAESVLRDALDLQRLTEKKFIFSREAFKLALVLRSKWRVAVESQKKPRIEHNSNLTAPTPKPTKEVIETVDAELEDVFVMGDSIRLAHVVDAFATNALKFAHKQVEFRLRKLPSTPKAPDQRPTVKVRFSVLDDGAGVKDKELLFQPYSQTRSGSQQEGGTGLGLALSKLFVEQGYEGIVKCEDNHPLGSEFYFEIDFQIASPEEIQLQIAATQAQTTTHTRSPNATQRVLVIDDNHASAEMIKDMLVCCQVACGCSAWGAIKSDDPNLTSADLVLIDHHTSGLPTGDVVSRLRSIGYLGPIIGIASSDSEKADMIAGGTADVLLKPLSIPSIKSVLQARLKNYNPTTD